MSEFSEGFIHCCGELSVLHDSRRDIDGEGCESCRCVECQESLDFFQEL